MTGATLNNGRRYVIDEGALYRVYGHSYGCLEIERIADGATVFFQGDDADQFRGELNAWSARKGLGMAPGLNDCDEACAPYSEIMEPV